MVGLSQKANDNELKFKETKTIYENLWFRWLMVHGMAEF